MLARLRACFYRRDTIPGGKRPAWSDASNKHVIGMDGRGAAFQVAEQRVADILRKRQSHLVSPFPHYLQGAAVPVDVCETQMRYVSGTQPQPRQHEYDRPVTKPSEVGTVTGGDQAFHVFCGQTLRQPGEPPVSDGGDREGEIVARFATEVEITQKCAEGGNQFLCGPSSTSAGTF